MPRKKAQKRIYLDYAAATPVDPRVFAAMKRYFSGAFGNASSIHREGVEAKRALEDARETVADALGAHTDEIIFTSGGTESNNLAIFGAVRAKEKAGTPLSRMHFITSTIEHPSVLDCMTSLLRRGAMVTYIGVSEEGIIDPKEVREALCEQTVLVSIGYGNGEIGVVQPIREIAKEIRAASVKKFQKPLFHTDASQAFAYLSCDVSHLGVDLMTLDAQKIYGPKGMSALFHRRLPAQAGGVSTSRLFEGGGQEGGLRPGTENVPLAVGFAKAVELLLNTREKEAKRLEKLAAYTRKKICAHIPEALVNGSIEKRLPNNVSISIPGHDGEFLALALDARGIAVGTGSACMLAAGDTSYVIRALGFDAKRALGTLRFSFGRTTKKRDIDMLVRALSEVISIQKRVSH